MTMRTQRHISNHRSGFTLLEMLVVGTIGSILLLFIANASRWFSRSVQAQQISIQLTQELKLAAEAIAQDFGPAISARTVDGSTVQIDTDDGDDVAQWAAPDTVVEYVIESNRLVRRDLDAPTGLPMANHITEIEAGVVNGKFQVKLTAKLRATEQTLTLQMEAS